MKGNGKELPMNEFYYDGSPIEEDEYIGDDYAAAFVEDWSEQEDEEGDKQP